MGALGRVRGLLDERGGKALVVGVEVVLLCAGGADGGAVSGGAGEGMRLMRARGGEAGDVPELRKR